MMRRSPPDTSNSAVDGNETLDPGCMAFSSAFMTHVIEQPAECLEYFIHRRLLVWIKLFIVHCMHHHGVVDFKNQQSAILCFRAIDTQIGQANAAVDLGQRQSMADREGVIEMCHAQCFLGALVRAL